MAESHLFPNSPPNNAHIYSQYHENYTANVVAFLHIIFHRHLLRWNTAAFILCCVLGSCVSSVLISLTSQIICENVALIIDIFYFIGKFPIFFLEMNKKPSDSTTPRLENKSNNNKVNVVQKSFLSNWKTTPCQLKKPYQKHVHCIVIRWHTCEDF